MDEIENREPNSQGTYTYSNGGKMLVNGRGVYPGSILNTTNMGKSLGIVQMEGFYK